MRRRKLNFDWNRWHAFPFNNVSVYVGENFKKAIPGYVDNLSITSGKSFLFPGSLARSLTTRKSNTFSQAGKPVSVGIHHWNSNPLLSTGRSDTLIPLDQTKWLEGDLNSRPMAMRANALTNWATQCLSLKPLPPRVNESQYVCSVSKSCFLPEWV